MKTGPKPRPLIDRLLAKVTEDANGCWIFTGSRTHAGYGQIRTGSRLLASTHRVMYEHFRAPIPPGLVIDHLCRVPSCCNPWHLEPVTQRENILRGDGPKTAGRELAERERSKVACKFGHAFDDVNTYRTKAGERQCRACKRRREAERKARLKTQGDAAA